MWENNPQSPDGEILKPTFQHMTPVQDIYMLPKTKPQHTHSLASTVCHVALFHAVLVRLRVCFCVKSQTIAGGSKQDWPERKIPPTAISGTSSVHICLSNTSIPNTHTLLKHRGHYLLPSCNFLPSFFLLHFQEQTKSRQ